MSKGIITTTKPDIILISGRAEHKRLFEYVNEVVYKCRLVSAKGGFDAVVEDAKRALGYALKYDMNYEVLSLSGFLHKYYSVRHEINKAHYYKQLRDEYLDIYNAWEEVDKVYLDMMYRANNTKHSKELIKELGDICARLDGYRKYNNLLLEIKIFRLKIVLAYLVKDYRQAADLCYTMIEKIESKGRAFAGGFYNMLIPYLILDKKYTAALNVSEKAIKKTARSLENKNIYLYSKFLALMHKGEYNAAYGVLNSVKRKKIENSALVDRWKIGKGYLSYLIDIGKVDIPAERKFKIGRYVNELSKVSTKDKEGFNVDLKIIEFLYYLKRDKGWVIDNEKAIKQYLIRIEKDRRKESRSAIFLEILNSFSRYDFGPELILSKNKTRIEKLKNLWGDSSELLAFEVIPFEVLLNLIINQLKQK